MRNKQKILLWLSKHKENKLAGFIYKFYEPLTYLIFGVLTTLVNVAVFTLLENILGQDSWYLSNLPAIFLAILFAYLTNRSFVFDSDGNFWVEMYKFFSARILVSLLFEYGATYILFNLLHIDLQLNLIVVRISVFKIISLTLVLIANYIASKVFVFRNAQVKEES
ncbi:MAG: GtrA family protein [Thermoclostridium sp.]|nr:GtrA family protein [Thermoclostridium sp.]